MKESTDLKKKTGKPNPFTVPENYFENIVPDIMSKLPEPEITEPEEVTAWGRIKPWVYMAAMFCGIMFGLKVIMKSQMNHSIAKAEQKSSVKVSDSLYIDEYVDPVGKQILMDDYTLYMYLTDSENENDN